MKKFLIIFSVFVAIGGGIFWLSKQEAPVIEIEDESYIVLENIKKKNLIDFSEPEVSEFIWNVETERGLGKILIKGQSIKAKKISREYYKKIELFFEESGFKIDKYNIASGTVAGSAGYMQDKIICVIASSFNNSDKYDIEIKCGEKRKGVDISIPEAVSEDEAIDVEIIQADDSENILIALELNPTTGYKWEGEYDEEYLEFINKEYITDSPELIGSGGSEVFNFLALKPGETEIEFFYARAWEDDPIQKKIYKIIIK